MFKTYTPRHSTTSLSLSAQAARATAFAERALRLATLAEIRNPATDPFRRQMLQEQIAREDARR